MRLADVVRLLEQKPDLPVKPMDIARILMEGNVREQFVFVGVDIDASILRGKLVQIETKDEGDGTFKRPYAENPCGLVSKVYYSTNQDEDMKGFVIIKELLHVLDPISLRTNTREKLAALVKKVSLPRELLAMVADTGINGHEEAMIDLLAQYRAVVAMVPEPHRLRILEKYNEQKLTVEEVSKLLGLPASYTKAALSDAWPAIRKLWLRI